MVAVRPGSKSSDVVAFQLGSKSPDTIVVRLASKSLDTVAIQLVSYRHGYYPTRVLNKQCYLRLTFLNFIKIRKVSQKITNKVYVWPKRRHLQSCPNMAKANIKKKKKIGPIP